MGDTTAATTLNQKVLEYARGKFDQQVGRGGPDRKGDISPAVIQ